MKEEATWMPGCQICALRPDGVQGCQGQTCINDIEAGHKHIIYICICMKKGRTAETKVAERDIIYV